MQFVPFIPVGISVLQQCSNDDSRGTRNETEQKTFAYLYKTKCCDVKRCLERREGAESVRFQVHQYSSGCTMTAWDSVILVNYAFLV